MQEVISNNTHIPSISFAFPWDREHERTLLQQPLDPATGKVSSIKPYIECWCSLTTKRYL